MVYLWEIADTFPQELIGVYDKTRSPDRFLLKQGNPIQFERVYFRFNARAAQLREMDDLANSALVPLVSPRVAEVLAQLTGAQVQLVFAQAATLDEKISDYRAVVATRQVTAIDHQASNYAYAPGTRSIMTFRKLRYKDDCLGSLHIARDAEYHAHLLVSDFLREALMELAPRGMIFCRPEDMRW